VLLVNTRQGSSKVPLPEPEHRSGCLIHANATADRVHCWATLLFRAWICERNRHLCGAELAVTPGSYVAYRNPLTNPGAWQHHALSSAPGAAQQVPA
jgi:hypothetical protein